MLREHELYANLAKCKFVQPELHFLGHIVGAQGLRVDPQKVATVQDWPVPKDKNSLQKFWGLANYFRKFIMGWAVLVSALQALLEKSDSFEWNADCDTAFDGIKHALCNAPVLALPDLNEPFEVICDACGVGLGAVLLQDGRPVAFDGKRLSPAEQNYSAGEQELLAVIHALELWRCYLDGVEFTVVTDHSPNTFFATKALLSPRQTRWAERLSRFQFCWKYRPGRINVADPLSRHPSFSANMVSATIATAELAQLSLSSVTDADIVAENDAAATADIEMLSQIYRGYETDPWFATASHTANLDIHQGLYYKGDDMSCTTPTMQAMWVVIELSTVCNACTGGLACTQPYASMCVAAKCASKTSTYKNSQQANSYLCLSLKPHGTVSRLIASPICQRQSKALLPF